jgi:hypothetical protein
VNPATALPKIANGGRVPGEQAPRSPEPARFRLLHHAVVVVTEGQSFRMRQAQTKTGGRLTKS